MKKRLLLAVLVGSGAAAIAQSPVQLDPNRQGTDPSSLSEVIAPNNNQVQGKRSVEEWYNFIDAADVSAGGAIDFTFYGNNFMFPDSTVKQRYADGAGGLILNGVNRHNIGEMFDPKSFYYTEILSEHNAYTVDSIQIGFRYRNNIPGTVDTLEIQVFYDDAILLGNLVDGNGNIIEATAWIAYNRTLGKGAGAKLEWREFLTETDTSWAQYATPGLKLPQTVSINRDGLIAVAYKYIPGFDYSPGDTLDSDWETPEPDKKLNEFQPLIASDQAETEEDSYNHGLGVRSVTKYDPDNNWGDNFIPGDAWIGFTEYVYIGFHIASNNVSVPVIDQASASVYPNPSNGSDVVNIEFATTENTDVTVELFDLMGNKIQTVLSGNVEAGNQIASANVAGLSSGIYVYTIKAGDQVVTGKLSVVK